MGSMAEPAVIVSSDSHIGPWLRDQLRDYCPAAYLDDYDAFLAEHEERTRGATNFANSEKSSQFDESMVTIQRLKRNEQAPGHTDMAGRLRDMDFEGIAAEVIFHGSANTETLPFRSKVFISEALPSERQLELMAVGAQTYNHWLADACTLEPERHVGLAQIPAWDIDASIREVEWARTAGLRGVNFPPPHAHYLPYNHPDWDRFWAVCADLRMPLTTHAGGGAKFGNAGPGDAQIYTVEEGGYFSRRALPVMIFGEVFERHPSLTLVLTEQPGAWWQYTLAELDSVYRRETNRHLWDRMQLPSHYFAHNVYIGASFMSHHEAQLAVDAGVADRFMWGRDYPHPEGTYLYPEPGDDLPMSQLALRDALHDLPPDDVAQITGLAAIACYGLDDRKLRAVAERIGAPTLDELRTPNDAGDPRVAAAIETARIGSTAFREGAGVWS
jgi:predicted TIM-barrel fold metal-dependent hydrolase